MSGAKSRRKGQRGELEFFNLMNSLLGADYFKRNLEQTRNGGADDDPTKHPYPVCVEVKRHKLVPLRPAQAQSIAAGEAVGRLPVLAYRDDGAPWRVCPILTPEQFARFLKVSREVYDDEPPI